MVPSLNSHQSACKLNACVTDAYPKLDLGVLPLSHALSCGEALLEMGILFHIPHAMMTNWEGRVLLVCLKIEYQ